MFNQIKHLIQFRKMADDGAEIQIRNVLKKIKTFQLNSSEYEIIQLSKPTVSGGGGETKTDIYIKAKNKLNNNEEEIKISYKKPNFSFVENKIKLNSCLLYTSPSPRDS